MEIKNNGQGYNIYCDRHMPLKLKRILESKEKTYIDEINKFAKSLEKFKEPNLRTIHILNKVKKRKGEENGYYGSDFSYENDEDEEDKVFETKLKEFLVRSMTNKFVIHLKKVTSENPNEQLKYEFNSLQIPKKGQMPYLTNKLKTNIPKDDPMWREFKFSTYCPEEVFKKYKKVVRIEWKQRCQQKQKLKQLNGHPKQ